MTSRGTPATSGTRAVTSLVVSTTVGRASSRMKAIRSAGYAGDAVEHPGQVTCHALDGRGVEQVGVVLQRAEQDIAVFLEVDGDVEDSCLPRHADVLDLQPDEPR